MKIKAAVVRETKKPYSIEELELEPPKEKEVLVKWAYTGYCCTDLHILSGELPFAPPLVGGHEAAGIVEDVGPGVTKVKKGDHVVGAWMAPCGSVRSAEEDGVRSAAPGQPVISVKAQCLTEHQGSKTKMARWYDTVFSYQLFPHTVLSRRLAQSLYEKIFLWNTHALWVAAYRQAGARLQTRLRFYQVILSRFLGSEA